MTKRKTEAYFLVRRGKAENAFELRETEIRELKTDELLIECEAFGLNYADVMARYGKYREAPPLPAVLGYEVVGKISDTGNESLKHLIGKRVLAFTRFGGYAKMAISTKNAFVEIDDIPASDALALCTQGSTAYYMAEVLNNIFPGDKILIHAAAGGVGSLLIQLARAKGAFIYAKVSSEEKAKKAIELGAYVAINYSKDDYASQLKNELNGSGLDLIFNPSGGSTFKKDMKLLNPGGRLVLFGGAELSSPGILSQLNFLRKMGIVIPVFMMMGSKSILGVNMLKLADQKPEMLQYCLANCLKLYQEKVLKPVSGGVFNFTDLAAAHALLESGKSTGKIIVCW